MDVSRPGPWQNRAHPQRPSQTRARLRSSFKPAGRRWVRHETLGVAGKGAGTVVRSTLRAVPATVPGPFSGARDHLIFGEPTAAVPSLAPQACVPPNTVSPTPTADKPDAPAKELPTWSADPNVCRGAAKWCVAKQPVERGNVD